MNNSKDISQVEFLKLCNGRDVATFLDIPYNRLMFMLGLNAAIKNHSEESRLKSQKLEVKGEIFEKKSANSILTKKSKRYVEKELVKKSGGLRLISIPNRSLLYLQKKICTQLNLIYVPPISAHGYIKSLNKSISNPPRTIVSNANVHKKSTVILNLDLKDFFPSITGPRIFHLFKKQPFNFSNSVAGILTEICIHDTMRCLPQGAATSPVLSNMITVRLDNKLLKLARNHDLKYTRFVDDITFSSNYKNSFNKEIIEKIYSVIEEEGFKVNPAKVRIQNQFNRQVVTGLTVNKKVNVKHDYIRSVRAMLKNLETKGLAVCQNEFKSKYFYNNNSDWEFSSDKPTENSYAEKRKNRVPDFMQVLRGRIEFIGNVRGKTKSQDAYGIYKSLLDKYMILTSKINNEQRIISVNNANNEDFMDLKDDFDPEKTY